MIIVLAGCNEWLTPILESKIRTQVKVNPEGCTDSFLIDAGKNISGTTIKIRLGYILKFGI
jgi:hypothetical protein